MPVNNVLRIVSNKDKSERHAKKQAKQRYFRSCQEAIDGIESDLAGYAIVVWTKSGNAISVLHCGDGLIGHGLVPTLVHDVINRHVAKVTGPAFKF